MKKNPLLLLIPAVLCLNIVAFAQETTTDDVERILAEIDTAEAPQETVDIDPVESDNMDIDPLDMDPVDPDPADIDGVNETAVEQSSTTTIDMPEATPVMNDPEMMDPMDDPVDDPTSVPAINLEEAESVDGLEIRGSDDTTSGLITLSYEDVKLADMVRIFAQTSGANIIIPEGLDELVSGNLNDVYWLEALEVILGAKGYILVERKSGIYTITTRDQMATEPLSTQTLDLQFITAEAALPAVQSLIVTSNASVTPIPQTNVLIISETAERLQEINRLVKLVDRPRRQVFIEAKFVELNDSAIKDLGINWQVLQGYTVRATGLSTEFERTDTRLDQDAQVFTTSRGRTRNSSSTRDTDIEIPGVSTGGTERLSTDSSTRFDGVVQGSNFEDFDAGEGTISSVPSLEQTIVKSGILSADDFALTLSALQQLDGTRIVSNPKMLVANGQTATIHVGRNEPNIRAVPQGENATTFAYVLDGFIEIGVKLEVTPVISTDKNITISIIPELSRLIGEKSVGEAGTSFPITQIRKINTEFAVESGKTVAIGGLTQTEDQENVNKIPLLGDIPIIGKYLFTHTSTRTVQDEIIIFVSVDSTHTEKMDDREGIPQHGTLIHTWLSHQASIDAKKAEAEAEAEAMQ